MSMSEKYTPLFMWPSMSMSVGRTRKDMLPTSLMPNAERRVLRMRCRMVRKIRFTRPD
jgi:hypothetical protein